MNFTVGSVVVMVVYKKLKVGKVIDRSLTKSGYVYEVKTEDGKLYDDILVDDKSNSIRISTSITNSFLKSKKR